MTSLFRPALPNQTHPRPAPPDQPQRQQALDPARSILVQAPAGSGKTDLLTRRFLRLLGEVDDPSQIVAITFTKAAAAEMRHRILSELEKAAAVTDPALTADEFSMDALARRALHRSRLFGWKLLDLPGQLRVSTIDSFCRELALQQPLLSGLGGGLNVSEQPTDLYRRAARRTLEQIDRTGSSLPASIEALLLWRDNGWQEMENLLVQMLSQRDRWMQNFVLGGEQDSETLRTRLERPFARAVSAAVAQLSGLLDQVPGACDEALALARFACEQSDHKLHQELAELAEFPCGPFAGNDSLDEARQACLCLGQLLLTGDGSLRKRVDVRLGFPADRKREKQRILDLIARLDAVPGLAAALCAVRDLPPARYTDEDWQIVRSCFTLLRQAAAELQVAFAEAGVVDFIEIAQIAQTVLADDEGLPTDAALTIADNIRHLLVDEFQDTSRRQHRLLAGIIAAWPERPGRTCFAVGDPMQSIYFFRDADAELFPRVQAVGLEAPNTEPLLFDFVPLTANFRTHPALVRQLNETFARVFAENDGSGVTFSPADPARHTGAGTDPRLALHLRFIPQTSRGKSADPEATQKNEQALQQRESAQEAQTQEIVALIRSHMQRLEQARAAGEKYRIAILGRTRSALAPIALALREAAIPFRAVDLEQLADRPEVLDALALAHALLNPQDRVAWLGVLRAPWCGLSLDDLHLLVSADSPELLARPIPELLPERLPLLSQEGQRAAARVLHALASVPVIRATQPTASLGTWLEQVWLSLGGADCADAAARANLDLLWSCLDLLPAGEQDLLGPGLASALEKLTAQPNPSASSDLGVQLMTIHKSKGLEFEVVIVPDLQAGGGRSRDRLLSWLERGLLEHDPANVDDAADDSGEITEFLVAPLQPKGADRGKAKAWVDRVCRDREWQETRRILYVAATRAREELHLFARPTYKTDADGALTLCEPSGSLLATAWPALAEEVTARFEEWKTATESSSIADIAASAPGNLRVMPSAIKPTPLRRLPADDRPAQAIGLSPTAAKAAELQFSGLPIEPSPLYTRHEGGLLSRALGSAVHALLEEFARLRIAMDWPAAREALQRLAPRIAAQIRAVGVEQDRAAGLAIEALDAALQASHDPTGQWILSPHSEAASEARWAGMVEDGLRIVQVDRVFRAGLTPQLVSPEPQDVWWIVDYKTAQSTALDPAAELPKLRAQFAPQLEAYAQVLRNLHGNTAPIRAGLYYPRMLLFDWWEL